jgi:DNA-binding CsgD family transcriptional regulator
MRLSLVALRTGEHGHARRLLVESLASARRDRDLHQLAYDLEGFACLAAAQRQSERALRLAGVADALREALSLPRSRFDRLWLDSWLSGSRAMVGEAAADAARAWAGRHGVLLEQAIAEADDLLRSVEQPDEEGTAGALAAASPSGETPGCRQLGGRLTARQLEVLRLVAQGKTDRQIAAELVLSEKTIGRHLENIFTRLGVSSRAAATVVAVRDGLV